MVATKDVVVEANQAKEEAKYESQQTTIITAEDIEKKQAKSVEDIIFSETGMSRNVDAMGRVTVSIRGAEPRHTLILVDGQPVMGDFAKYSGQADELQRLGTENVERIEIIQGAASAKYGSDAIGGVINVVTKKAAKDAGLQVNVEGRRAKSDGDIFPYQNFFLRADSGQIGKFRAAVYGSKREIMPSYSTETFGGVNTSSSDTTENSRVRNSLRYYGDIKNIGVTATYDINDRNSIDFTMDKTDEDMERYVKHSDSGMEPQQHFKRDLERNTWRLHYTGNNGSSTDWTVDADYSKLTEDDITLSSYYSNSKYEGKNTLNYVDDLMHKQWNFKASANTQLNDKHLLTYGFGYSREKGEGSRLKGAPESQTYTRYIDPWDYDKNLYTKGGTGAPSSTVHDYYMSKNADGIPYYDQNYELYGVKDENGNSMVPAFTYQDYIQYGAYNASARDKINEFGTELMAENTNVLGTNSAVNHYYNPIWNDATWHDRKFKEEYNLRQNRQTVGWAEIKKQNFYIGDTWQVNDDTILAPIVRLDHSDLFGSEVTFNLGLTHNLGGHANRRFKANIGTGYTEPGMGELYYNWEMYAGMPTGLGIGKLGYYWIGNPDLKPEKSVNFDIGFEAESSKTSTRLNVFHNKIDDYMTTYFTGYLMDFNPDETDWKWMTPPDMIYSFKNIGKAEITGVEAEINQKFGKHWSGKLGYTYLHAINKSDPTMPRQLLNKPQHKVDIGVTYENAGWRASLWGDYYIHMLDSNSIANNGNYLTYDSAGNVKYNFAEGGKQTYQKKTFGLWNILVQKQIDKDSSVYVGIDNLFNHRDDDQAFMERVYKFGVNLKFGSDGSVKADAPTVEKAMDAARKKLSGKEKTDWFIKAPFDTTKKEGVEVIGDYRARWNSFTGEVKPSEARVTATASVGSAYKNYLEKADHGFEQRLRLGVDARIGENTNVTILGSASGMSGVDTMYDKSDSKGLNHQRVENIDVTQHVNKWDFSVGRLTEPMGVTGYWFGKEYDGGRAVWTSGKNQVRIGYGDFSHSTGIKDSAYTHATKQLFYRSPTKIEWLGVVPNTTAYIPYGSGYSDRTVSTEGYKSLHQKLAEAGSMEEKRNILEQYLEVVKQDSPDAYNKIINGNYSSYINTFAWEKVTITNSDTGELVREYIQPVDDIDLNTTTKKEKYIKGYRADGTPKYGYKYTYLTYDDIWDTEKLEQKAAVIWDNMVTNVFDTTTKVTERGSNTWTTELIYGRYTGNQILNVHSISKSTLSMDEIKDNFIVYTQEEAKEHAIRSLWDASEQWRIMYAWKQNSSGGGTSNTGYKSGSEINSFLTEILFTNLGNTLANCWVPEDNSSMPLTLLRSDDVIGGGNVVPVLGTVLVQDQIPAIDRAAFVQYKHQMGDHFGVQAWYLRSVNDDTHSLAYAHGDSNDIYSYDRLANIIGLGAAWRVGDNLRFSFDWGQNRTDFGRMMNGNTIYSHESGTSDFDIEGRSKGGTPRFWVARVDVGHADMDVPGSWNAFADYKYFQHGSFFGGNGTEALPDRYLDGIKSFTIGGGYVPAKDFLIEAFYTFDAKGIGKRDTLYGGENFTIGDYTRIQATFRF